MMLVRLPIERFVQIDPEKVSIASDFPTWSTPSFYMVIDGHDFVFVGDEYEPVKNFWIDWKERGLTLMDIESLRDGYTVYDQDRNIKYGEDEYFFNQKSRQK